MSKPTEQEIEDQLANEIYEVMSRQSFYDFYMAEDTDSFTAHIQCDDKCVSKEEVIKELKSLFHPVIKKAKELVSCQ